MRESEKIESSPEAPSRASLPRALVALTGCVAVLAGCGSTSSYRNDPRPPAPIVITGAIVGNRVTLSPARFGAGPIELVIANLTGSSQQVTVETNNLGTDQPGISQQTAPINPQDTADLKLTLTPGTYSVHTQGDAIKAATLSVGASRPSSQNQLLQP